MTEFFAAASLNLRRGNIGRPNAALAQERRDMRN
jgi:hypothetical protein